jgi:hypothetical protein
MPAEAILLALECLVLDQTPERSGAARRQAAYRERNALRNKHNGDVTVTDNGVGKEKVSQTLPKEKINNTTREAHSALVHRICEVVNDIEGPLPDEATACHDAVEAALRCEGLEVFREAQVNNGDGITGRFDLLVKDNGQRVAIEIDFRLARAKSTQKLLGFDGGRIQILRGSTPPQPIAGIDACLSLPVVKDSGLAELPAGWEPDAKIWALADQLGLSSGDVWDQVDRMRDWARNAGAKGKKKDWSAFFRNWLKRRADDRRNKPKAAIQRNSLADSFAILDAVTDEAIRRTDRRREEGGEEDFGQLPRLRKSAA